VLRQAPCGLITDIDGTISAIAPSPSRARVPPALRQLLRRLAQRLALVAAVSGRPAEEARRMVGVPEMVYLGSHGLERWAEGQVRRRPEVEPYIPQIEAALVELRYQLSGIKGLLFETKGATAAVHYRACPDPPRARQAILGALATAPSAQGLKVTQGKMVVELRPPLALDKGSAVAELVAEYGLRGAFYLGDDATDADAFLALRKLREAGRCASLGLAVVGPETPPQVRQHADLTLHGLAEVQRFLTWLAERAP